MSKTAAMEKKSSLLEYVSPSVVLVVICLVTTLALASVYQITKPIIAEINRIIYEKTQIAVLPQAAEGFDPYEGDLLEGIQAVSLSKQEVGTVVTVVEKGYGGPLTVMVGIGSDGVITGIQILSHKETPGLGTKTMTETHLGQYIGQSDITNTGESGAGQIDAISGATISSKALFAAINDCVNCYNELA